MRSQQPDGGASEGSLHPLLNNDAELYPDALRALHDEAEAIGEPAILSLPQYDFVTGELIDRGCLLDPFFNPVPNLDPGRRDVAMVIGACLWIPGPLEGIGWLSGVVRFDRGRHVLVLSGAARGQSGSCVL